MFPDIFSSDFVPSCLCCQQNRCACLCCFDFVFHQWPHRWSSAISAPHLVHCRHFLRFFAASLRLPAATPVLPFTVPPFKVSFFYFTSTFPPFLNSFSTVQLRGFLLLFQTFLTVNFCFSAKWPHRPQHLAFGLSSVFYSVPQMQTKILAIWHKVWW